MGSALNRFNRIGWIYDKLVELVFGKNLALAQQFYLTTIPQRANVLILGGGTGEILKALTLRDPDCNVYYVEASSAMIARAKKRIPQPFPNVHFIHGNEDSIPEGIPFDTVITGFFLDMFSQRALARVIRKIDHVLKSEGLWLAIDFIHSANWKHRILLKTMFLFFRMMGMIEVTELPHWNEAIVATGFYEREAKLFYNRFIKSAVFCKP